MTVRDGIRRTRLHTISAEDAARVVDVINARVALARGNTIDICILGGFNVDAIRRTCSGAEKTAHALLQSIFVAVQDVDPAVARLEVHWFVRVVFRDCLAKNITESHAETLHQRPSSFYHFAYDGWHRLEV